MQINLSTDYKREVHTTIPSKSNRKKKDKQKGQKNNNKTKQRKLMHLLQSIGQLVHGYFSEQAAF